MTGSGTAPDVQVTGTLNGTVMGTLCLAGPANLSASIDVTQPNFSDYFSVTLPKSWIQDGLELTVTAGSDSRLISSEELKIGPYTEMNLTMVNMDVMDYNGAPHQNPIFDDFLQEMASAIPASVVRFGIFPETMKFPEIVASNDTEQMVRLNSRSAMGDNGVPDDGYINAIAILFLENLHQSTSDYLSTVYFGNTLNLSPGGWGGGKSFVGFDYTDIFIHELGHALSLPHWGDAYDIENPQEWDFLYPYGGVDGEGGGRGEAWNFIQDIYEFVDPTCLDENNESEGLERSDCMQRNYSCLEKRSDGLSPWDGFGDFSTLAMHRYLMGAALASGQVIDQGQVKDFQLTEQEGFPNMTLENGERVYTRDALQPELSFNQELLMPGEEQLNQDVYLIYGSAHETQPQANIVYKPIKYNGTLAPIIDLTDPVIFAEMQNEIYISQYYETRDITLKMTYEDGSVLHALNPFHSYERAPYEEGFGIWRRDVCNFSLVVPADKNLTKVELFRRPFCVRWDDVDTEGNINYAPNNITAENFMDGAIYQTEYDFGAPLVLGSNTIGNRVWHDLNQNGINEDHEPGIADVSLIIWSDGDGDGIPDGEGFGGVVKTDENGYYTFSGLGTGNYLVFVWSVDNWDAGEPLNGMIPTSNFVENPNSDINLDNNGRPGNIAPWGLTDVDIVSGMITLTADGEPLEDGDREDCWFDYDSSGNMTIDFGFHVEGATVSVDAALKNQNHQIYPNPFQDYFLVETEIFADRSVSVISTDGKVVFKSELATYSSKIDLKNLQEGIYFVVIKDKMGTIEWSGSLVKGGR